MILMLDNNILIEKLCHREPFYDTSNKVLMLGVFGDADLYISTTMLTDIHYILSREHGNQQAQAILMENMGTLKLCGVSAADSLWALQQQWPDFEDCLVARAAENVKADFIVSRDVNGFKQSKIQAISPEDLLERIKDEKGISYHEVL